MIRCKICGKRIKLDKSKTYQTKIEENNIFSRGLAIYDAIDCEKCGAQNLLGKRFKKNEENVKAAEQEYHGKLVDLDEYTKAVCQASCNKKLYECNNRCSQVKVLLAMPTVKDATWGYKLKNYVIGMKENNNGQNT